MRLGFLCCKKTTPFLGAWVVNRVMSAFLSVLRGQPAPRIPIWLMRQAGRYLPEYRALRAETTDFLSFCYDTPRAAEATLQPLRRFDLDAAIIFSDILVIPDALGQGVSFDVGHGPRLAPVKDLATLSFRPDHLAPVYAAIKAVRAALPPEKALIGFAGSPFTLMAYMIEGQGSKTFDRALHFIYTRPDDAAFLRNLLEESIIQHLSAQIQAGADAVQLFDSWAGMVPAPLYKDWVILPHQRIVAALRSHHPHVPIVCFPRGSGVKLADFARAVQPDGISVDTSTHMGWALDNLPEAITLQGNLDPALLCAGGRGLEDAVQSLKDICSGRRWIMNLGHGVVPATPPDHVKRVVDVLKNRL
jgi:uroporphyrinogen decarboxylase